MDKRSSCANCSSTDHHASACPAYRQDMMATVLALKLKLLLLQPGQSFELVLIDQSSEIYLRIKINQVTKKIML